MLNWDQVREMNESGIDFGSHTETHPLLPYETESAIEQELRLSKRTIEGATESRVDVFAYPNGDWNERVRSQVEQAGYEGAFTVGNSWCDPKQDRYTSPRIMLHDGNVTGLRGRFSPAVFSLTLAAWRTD